MFCNFRTHKIINPSTFASLSTLQAIMLQVLAFAVTLGYGIYHLLYDKAAIGGVALCAALFSMLCIFSIYKKPLNGYYFMAFFTAQFLCLVATSYFYGLRGLILIFPVSASAFYVFYYRLAFYASLMLVVSSLWAAAHVLSGPMLVRVSVALFLSISFLAAFSYVVTKQYKDLVHDANHDHLTRMLNRRGFGRWLKSALTLTKKEGGPLTLFHLDLDGFRGVNDSFGQSCGDDLLRKFPRRVLQILHSGVLVDTGASSCHLARLSGDEFALAVIGLESRAQAEEVAAAIINSVIEPFQASGIELRVSLSVGIADAEAADYQFNTLLRQANSAMHEEKRLGRSGYYYFDEDIANRENRQESIEALIRTALDSGGFVMAYQPIYHCDTQILKGAEALIRCPAASALGVYPDTFIPIAEKVGLIRRLDLWVLEAVLKDIHALPEGCEYKGLVYSINISALELQNTLFPNSVRLMLHKYPVAIDKIQLEITETSLIALDDRCMSVLRELSDIGVGLVLDDFGTGYTAFNQLRSYPVQALKIDRSFIVALDEDFDQASAMIELILSLADLYHLEVTAEGVETHEQLNFLKTTRCNYIQGYVMARPMPWHAFLDLPSVVSHSSGLSRLGNTGS